MPIAIGKSTLVFALCHPLHSNQLISAILSVARRLVLVRAMVDAFPQYAVCSWPDVSSRRPARNPERLNQKVDEQPDFGQEVFARRVDSVDAQHYRSVLGQHLDQSARLDIGSDKKCGLQNDPLMQQGSHPAGVAIVGPHRRRNPDRHRAVRTCEGPLVAAVDVTVSEQLMFRQLVGMVRRAGMREVPW